MTNRRQTIVLGLVAVLAGACQDLDTENLTAPDAQRALSEPGDVEALIGSAFRTWYYAHQNDNPSWALSTAADEGTASWGNYGMQQISSEPREAFPNSTGYTYIDVIEEPWYGMYRALSAANDGLAAIAGGLQFGENGEDTPRAQAFGKFMQGLSHGILALLFDRAFIYRETDDLATTEFQLTDYGEVMTAAIEMLDEAASIASSNTFTLPDNWIGGQALTSAQLAQVAKSYSARFMAAVARTPEERAAVNWADVIARVDAGIQQDFGPILDNTNWGDLYKNYISRFDWFRTDYRLIGPADISGNYQAWVATPVADRQPFDITTPDRRIVGPEPNTDGTDFYYRATQNHREDRGTYHFSRYGSKRYMYIRQTNIGFNPIMTVAEMDMLKAEGLIRQGQNAQAAELINRTRTTRGELPPLTADGVPQSDDCVPRTETGACANLMQALIYEKRVETYAISGGLAYFEARGWGFLVEGTPFHLPIPARELETLGIPAYTFGGVGGIGAAQ